MFGYMAPPKKSFQFFLYHEMCGYLNCLPHMSDFQTDLREPSNNKRYFQKMSNKLDFCHHTTAPAPYAYKTLEGILVFAAVISFKPQQLQKLLFPCPELPQIHQHHH